MIHELAAKRCGCACAEPMPAGLALRAPFMRDTMPGWSRVFSLSLSDTMPGERWLRSRTCGWTALGRCCGAEGSRAERFACATRDAEPQESRKLNKSRKIGKRDSRPFLVDSSPVFASSSSEPAAPAQLGYRRAAPCPPLFVPLFATLCAPSVCRHARTKRNQGAANACNTLTPSPMRPALGPAQPMGARRDTRAQGHPRPEHAVQAAVSNRQARSKSGTAALPTANCRTASVTACSSCAPTRTVPCLSAKHDTNHTPSAPQHSQPTHTCLFRRRPGLFRPAIPLAHAASAPELSASFFASQRHYTGRRATRRLGQLRSSLATH
jgi:hypothetical protein